MTDPAETDPAERDITELLDSSYDLPPVTPSLRYAVIGAPRAGTTWLCDVLADTGEAGSPHEFLHPKLMAQESRRTGKRFQPGAYLDGLEARRTTANGSFGLKLFPAATMGRFPEDQRWPFIRFVLNRFDRLVFVRRRDKIRQAVSFELAMQTRRWELRDEATRAADRAARAELAPSYTMLAQRLWQLIGEDQRCRAVLADQGASYLELCYEDLLADPQHEFGRLFGYLGIEADPAAHQAGLLVSRDAHSEALAQGFAAYIGRPG